MDTETPDTLKSHAQHVDSDPQWAIGHYILLTINSPNLIHDKLK